MRNISAWSIKNPVPPLVLFALLLLAGVLSFRAMDINNQPDVEFPGAQIIVAQPGAAPAELENQVTQRVEAAVGRTLLHRHEHLEMRVGGGAGFRLRQRKRLVVGIGNEDGVGPVHDHTPRLICDRRCARRRAPTIMLRFGSALRYVQVLP